MRRHRIIWAAALTATVLCMQTAAADASSTLLSGYGGPGQGNQAIIGSTLIGGGGSGGGSASAASGAAVQSPASIALPAATAHRPAKGSKRQHGAAHHTKAATPAKTTGPPVSPRSSLPAAAGSAGGGTLGLTGADVVYIILAFCVLAATALLTARLTGRSGRAPGAR